MIKIQCYNGENHYDAHINAADVESVQTPMTRRFSEHGVKCDVILRSGRAYRCTEVQDVVAARVAGTSTPQSFWPKVEPTPWVWGGSMNAASILIA